MAYRRTFDMLRDASSKVSDFEVWGWDVGRNMRQSYDLDREKIMISVVALPTPRHCRPQATGTMTFRPCRLEKWSENDWNTNAIQRHIKWAQTTSSRGAHSGQRSRWPICLATAASLAAMPRHYESEFNSTAEIWKLALGRAEKVPEIHRNT